jgi:predicted nicotinamide N-methyase
VWITVTIGGRRWQLLDLDHPQIVRRILAEIDAGIAVYYDRRWASTERLGRLLVAEPHWVTDRNVLVLGAGVGLETVVIGSLCNTLYVNDLAPVALELCAQQLRQNGLTDFVCLPGHYEHLQLPPVDLIVGCFLVYNRETAAAMQQLLQRPTPPVLLMNDNMTVFQQLVRNTRRGKCHLLPADDTPCVLLSWEAPGTAEQ